MERNFSGRFVVRVPTSLHRHLAEQAQQQRVSLNQLVVALLAGGSNFALPDTKPSPADPFDAALRNEVSIETVTAIEGRRRPK
jgi:HicB-like protein involved in pilus formation